MASGQKIRVAKMVAASVVVPTIPVLVWWRSAVQDRKRHAEEERTKVRIPNVQTVDDLLIERCQPGDILLFDRRCEKCAAGPLAALSCLVGQQFLCDNENSDGRRTVDIGSFDHCGIVVPGRNKNGKDVYDPYNLMLLEATASEGIVARPLLTRLEMSQSRSVLLLPLSSPGELRNDTESDLSDKTQKVQEYMSKRLVEFRDKWEAISQTQGYASAHSTLGIIGAVGYGLGWMKYNKAPVNPSAFLVVSALQDAGAGENIAKNAAFHAKPEDFLRDHRFHESDTVRLRPGWKFLSPVTMRERSRS